MISERRERQFLNPLGLGMDPNLAPLLRIGIGYASNSNNLSASFGDGRLNKDVSQSLTTFPSLAPNRPSADPHDPGTTHAAAERQPSTEIPVPTPKREP
jgi:hypothetical protein